MAEKTEQPTPKKLRDAAKKGQTFKSRDITTIIVLCVGALALSKVVDLKRVIFEFSFVAATGAMPDPTGYAISWAKIFLILVTPFVLLCALAGIFPSLVQSRFQLASEAIKLDLTALDPVKGLKKLFSWRSLKEVVKAALYLIVVAVTVRVFINLHHRELFALFRAPVALLAHMWITLTVQLILIFVLCSLPVLLLDGAVEYFLYFKDLKMEKHEVKQEHKESDGNPEIKSKRREAHMELLSEEIKSNIEQSDFILANPTHIAIGIYMNADIVPVPFVSVRETNARALAVRRYAELKGVPVVRDVSLARSVYRNSRRYGFVSGEDFEAVMRVLIWLKQVEATRSGASIAEDAQEADAQEAIDEQEPTDPDSAAAEPGLEPPQRKTLDKFD